MTAPMAISNYLAQPRLRIIFDVVELCQCIELNQRSVILWEIVKEIIPMTPEQTVQLINLLVSKRREAGLSNNEVARRAKVDPGTVWRIEQGMIPTPKAESLQAIGKVLDIPAVDLFTTVGWLSGSDLPSLNVYLRAKYGQLPDEALKNIEEHIEAVATRSGFVLHNTAKADPMKGDEPL